MAAAEQKPKLIVFCALAALQDEYTPELQKLLPKSVLLNKNTLTDALLDGKNHTTPEYQVVKKNMYEALNQMALDQLQIGNTVVLHGYYGDKLTKPGTVEYIAPESDAYDVYIIYLHCSGARHQEIIAGRGSDRDNDKKGDKYNPYRVVHIRNHLQELAQISNVLFVDVDQDNFAENMQKILGYVDAPAASIHVNALSDTAMQRLQDLTLDEAMGGLDTFNTLLNELKSLSSIQQDKAIITPLYALKNGISNVVTKSYSSLSLTP